LGNSTENGCGRANVLIIEKSRENLEVLETAVQRRGMNPLGTRWPSQGLEIIRQQNPDLILLDIEAISSKNSQICEQFEAESSARQTPLVVLGKNRRSRRDLPSGEQVTKPYHYAALVRRIEELLDLPHPANSRTAA